MLLKVFAPEIVCAALRVTIPAPTNEVAPVPPFATDKIPVTPGVILALPLKLAVEVLLKLVLIVLDVVKVSAFRGG